MAPKWADVKSESWLDLSVGSRNEGNRSSQNLTSSTRSVTPLLMRRRASLVSQQHFPANQHLLIRLRQQSFLNNRSSSSTTTLSSNLSNSIEFKPNQLIDAPPSSPGSGGGELYLRDAKLDKQAGNCDLLKGQSRGLDKMRDKLERGHRRRKLYADTDSGSPLARSLSSFSERLGGKLSNLSHSCKNFLYNYNKSRQDGKQRRFVDEQEQEQGRDITATAAACYLARSMSAINKRQQTNDWITRHHKQLAFERPRSLEVSSLCPFGQNDLQANEGNNSNNNGTNFPATFSPIEAPNKVGSPTTSSSTTLVSSQQQQDIFGEQQLKTVWRQSREFGEHKDHINMMVKGNTRIQRQEQQQQRIAPSSDFTRLTMGDYFATNKQQVNSPIGDKLVECELSNSSGGNNSLLCQQPILLSDQDYYLDVANASAATAMAKLHLIQQQQPQLNDLIHTRISIHQNNNINNHQQDLLLQQQSNEQLNEDYDDYAVPSDESCRLDRSQVELVQMIGEGQKGYVFMGKLQSKDGKIITDVAIKTLKYETEQLIEKLMREAAMMRQFEHPHIIKFIGVCPETPALIAMELAEFGELKQYLKLNQHLIAPSQLILFAFQISTALSYLESKQFVHRDVAARNVLVCSHNCVKLADFGLSRSLQEQHQEQAHTYEDQNWLSPLPIDPSADQSLYVAAARVKLPVRWLAPESLAFRRFTSASDVWMFAVCSWEIFQYGHQRPWSQIRNNRVLLAIESGQRLTRPPNCPARLYQLMLQCWSYAPAQRPKFRELKQDLWSIYLNERAKEQLELQLEREQRLAASKQQQQDRILMLIRQQQQYQQAMQQRLSTSPLVVNYASGYSSAATATADNLSNNSSRSSSIGSLARQRATKQASAQQQPLAGSGAQQLRIEANMKRFERAPGHMLQKQRSHGSIVTEADDRRRQEGAELRSRQPNWAGFCDDAALADYGRLRRQASGELRPRLQLDDQDDDSSEAGETTNRQRELSRRRFNQPARPAAYLEQLPSSQFESHYEGLNKLVLVTRRAETCTPDVARSRPLSCAGSGPSRTGDREDGSSGNNRDERLANVLQALQFAPMKARLRKAQQASRQSSIEPSGARLARQRLDGLPVQASRQQQPAGVSRSSGLSQQPKQQQPEINSSLSVEQRQHEERQRQLALHQRLLGHIRPAFVHKRRSVQLQEQGQQQLVVGATNQQLQQPTSVEQSLQILESLIGDKGFNRGANDESPIYEHMQLRQQQQQQHQQQQQPQLSKKHRFNLALSRPRG